MNGVTPQKRYSYVQRVARLADGSAAGPPVWLLDRMSTCRAGNPGGAGCALGAADEVVTAYEYGPDSASNNLLLRGQSVIADGQTLRTCFAYDRLGRKISETSPGGTAALAACPVAAPITALPFTSSTRFDADGRVTGTIAPDPDGTGPLPHPAVRNSYDVAGRLIRVEEGYLAAWQPETVPPALWPGFVPVKWIDRSYDPLDRKTRESVSGAGVTEYSYDVAGRLQCTAVRMNPDAWASALADTCVPGPVHAVHGADRISRNVHDTAGRLTEAWDGVGTPLQRREAAYTYNASDQKLSLTDARGYRAEMTYDGFGRQQRWIFPSKTTPGVADPADYEQYLYDGDGNRVSLRKRDGQLIGFEYDALNRVTLKLVPMFGLNVRYAYDLRGLQTRAFFTGTGWGVTNVYDGLGRLTSTVSNMGGFSRTIAHRYDREGRETELTFPDGQSFWTARDGLGRVTEAYQGPLGSTATIMTAYAYDAASRRQVFARRFGDRTVYGYDPAGRLASLNETFGAGIGNTRYDYTYNPASQLRTETRTNDSYAWKDSVAVSRNYATNGQNQYTGTVSDGTTSARSTAPPRERPSSSTTATSWSRNIMRAGRCSGATSTATRMTILNIITKAPGSSSRGSLTPTTRARSPQPPAPARRRYGSTPTTNTASPETTKAGSNTPAKPGCPSWACITTRPESTRPRSGGSCRPTRSGMMIRSIFMLILETILSTPMILWGLQPFMCTKGA